MQSETTISRELMGKIVDEVFDGAIEDASVIEEIYAVIKREEANLSKVDEQKPLDLNITQDWFEKRSALEADHEIGAGSRKLTACIDPTPDELTELFKIAHRIPDGWKLVPVSALSAAEPYGWMVKTKGSSVKGTFFGHEPHFSDGTWDRDDYDVIPVYDRPPQPAPSVAVKAQQAVWIKHDGKRMPVNAETIVEVRMASGFEYEADLAGNWLEREGSKSNWHHELGCPHPCDIVAYRIVTISPALSAQVQDARSDDDEEIYEIGVREGYERAVQEIDMRTGGDGEYRYCTDHDPERHTPGPAEMIQRIVDRFETLNLIEDAEKRGDFWDAPGSAQVQDVAGAVIKLGTYGRAYDRPEERRAYTYEHQPGNIEAYKLGRVCSDVHSGGDWIDRGLNLLNALRREGFGVFELPAAPAKQEGGE
ncbi:hypothetical protein [Agrobacterium leguminum]